MTRVGDLTLREATLDDAAAVADIDTELHPDDPEDPRMMRHWWEMSPGDDVNERHMVTRDGAIAGYTRFGHASWDTVRERFARITAELAPAHRTAERLDALYAMLEDRGRADGTAAVTTWAHEGDRLRIAMLEARGYREERRERFWELDLVKEHERITAMAVESRERMRREGIRVLTLADDDDPRRWERLKRMSDEAEADVPTTVPHVPIAMELWMKWYDSPAIHLDRAWIAREGDDIVGVSQLAYPPVRGVVSTDWTGTARAVRGRGVARALKCETLVQAIALGVDRVRTDNDSQNAPILHINETMGYRRRPDQIQFLKAL